MYWAMSREAIRNEVMLQIVDRCCSDIRSPAVSSFRNRWDHLKLTKSSQNIGPFPRFSVAPSYITGLALPVEGFFLTDGISLQLQLYGADVRQKLLV